MISRIKFANLKGRSESIGLEPITIIYGDNDSGKTTIVDALMLDMLGYHPVFGKLPSGIREIATPGRPLTISSVRCIGKDQFTRNQEWSISNRYAVQSDLEFTPPIAVNLRTFFELSGRERKQFLLERADLPNSINVTDISKCLLESPTEAAMELLDGDSRIWERCVAEVLSAAESLTNPVKWVSTALESAESFKAKFAKAAKEKRAAVVAGSTIDAAEVIVNKSAELVKSEIDLSDQEKKITNCVKEREDASSKRYQHNARIGDLTRRLSATKGTIWVCPTCRTTHKRPPSKESAATINEEIAATEVSIKSLCTKLEQLNATERELRKVYDSMWSAVRLLKEHQKRYTESVGRAKALAQAEDLASQEKLTASLYGEIANWLKRKADEINLIGMKSILGDANCSLKKIWDSEIVFQQGEFRVIDKGGFNLSIDAMAGAKQVVINAGLQLALTKSHKEPTIIIDEFNRVDKTHKIAILRDAGERIKAGTLAQAIFVDIEDPCTYLDFSEVDHTDYYKIIKR